MPQREKPRDPLNYNPLVYSVVLRTYNNYLLFTPRVKYVVQLLRSGLGRALREHPSTKPNASTQSLDTNLIVWYEFCVNLYRIDVCQTHVNFTSGISLVR